MRLTFLGLLNAGTLTGSIPPQFSVLTNMVSMDLSNNDLSGSFPDGLTLLNKLTYGNVCCWSHFAGLSAMWATECMYLVVFGRATA